MNARAASVLVAVLLCGLLAVGCQRQQPAPAPPVAMPPPAPPPGEEEPAAPTSEEPEEPAEEPAPVAEEKPYPDVEGTVVKLETDMGDIVLELYDDDLPRTVSNFKELVEDGYYDGLTFYRVEDWVIQAGENPRGPGRGLKFETHPDRTHDRGALGLARSTDPDSGRTEFYIVKRDAHELDDAVRREQTGGRERGYCCFGRTIEGLDVVDLIRRGDKIKRATIVQEAD